MLKRKKMFTSAMLVGVLAMLPLLGGVATANATDTDGVIKHVPAALAKCLGGGTIYKMDMTDVDFLICNNKKLTTIAPLSYATEMYYLELSHNKLTNISALKKMKWLFYLDVSYNKLSTDLSALSKLQYLDTVKVTHNRLTKTTGLEASVKSKELRKVYLSYNRISKISGLSSVPYVSASGQNLNSKVVSAKKGKKVTLPVVGFDGKKIVVTAPKKAGKKVVKWSNSPDKKHIFSGTITLKVK